MTDDDRKMLLDECRACVELLEFLSPQLVYGDSIAHRRDGEMHYFTWTGLHSGRVLVVPFTRHSLVGLGKRVQKGVESAAERGEVFGVGAYSVLTGSVLITAYLPPGWPVVVLEDGSRKKVSLNLPGDEALRSMLVDGFSANGDGPLELEDGDAWPYCAA